MNADLSALLRAVRTALSDEVRPHVGDEQARIQLAAVLDILGKLEGMTDWAPQALQEQAEALEAGVAAFEAHAMKAGLQLPAAPSTPSAPQRSTNGRAGLDRAQSRIEQLTDWLFAQSDLAAPLRAELDARLRAALRQQLVAERKRIPLTDFASMSAGGGPRED